MHHEVELPSFDDGMAMIDTYTTSKGVAVWMGYSILSIRSAWTVFQSDPGLNDCDSDFRRCHLEARIEGVSLTKVDLIRYHFAEFFSQIWDPNKVMVGSPSALAAD